MEGSSPLRMRFINLTRATEIGANSYYLELAGQRIAIDAGMHPKRIGEAATPDYRAIPADKLDAIFLSHAHQDHVGTLPILMRRFGDAPVYLTSPTARLADVMLHNSINVMSRQKEDAGVLEYPLFTHREADQIMNRWREVRLNERRCFSGERAHSAETSFCFFDAGHILGSVGILFYAEGKKIFYTGDVNFLDQTLMRSADFPLEPLDVLIIETTRGDRALASQYSRADEEQRFLAAIETGFARDGSILVPVFALGKTQEVLTMLVKFRLEGHLRDVPVYIGGLSTKVTQVHDQLALFSVRQHNGLQLLDTIAPYVLNGREIATTQVNRKRLYVLSSGMMTEKTLSNQLGSRFIDNPQPSIYFVAYTDPRSSGARFREARSGDRVQLDQDLPSQSLRATVEEFDFSAHAPREALLEYIKRTTPKKVVLVHGDPPAIAWFEQAINKYLPQTEVIVPLPAKEYEL